MLSKPLLSAARFVTLSACILCGLFCVGVEAQSLPPVTHAASPVVKSVAVVAAAGDQFQYIRRKPVAASRIDPYIRRWGTMPGNGLNMMVLRGMDRALSGQYPAAELTLLTLTPIPEDQKVRPQEREAYTMRRVMDYLQSLPERAKWDEIIVVTPKWFFDERKGMGSRLSGIGLFVQPVATGLGDMAEEGEAIEDDVRDVTSAEFKKPRSGTYVAPFFYMQVTVLEGKTLKVLRREERYDFRKIINSESTSLDVEQTISPKQLASEIERFVETAARRMIVDKEGSVEVGPVRTLPEPNK